MNILISCAGGPAAVGVIKSVSEFNDSTHKVVAIDCDELSVGFHLADKSYVVPFSVEDDFWKEVLKVIRYEKIDLVIPTGDADIVHFSKNKNVLKKMGVTVFMSDYDSIIKAIGTDSRIGFSHTQVPGPDNKIGFGGACFPKDTQAFSSFAKNKFTVLDKVIEENNK